MRQIGLVLVLAGSSWAQGLTSQSADYGPIPGSYRCVLKVPIVGFGETWLANACYKSKSGLPLKWAYLPTGTLLIYDDAGYVYDYIGSTRPKASIVEYPR